MNTGKVKFFNKEKMFGFIIDDKSGQELFVHKSGLVDEIRENDEVSFDTIDGKKGVNCTNVRRTA